MFSNVWSENTALFERLMEIHSNAPKLYYGFKSRFAFSPISTTSKMALNRFAIKLFKYSFYLSDANYGHVDQYTHTHTHTHGGSLWVWGVCDCVYECMCLCVKHRVKILPLLLV